MKGGGSGEGGWKDGKSRGNQPRRGGVEAPTTFNEITSEQHQKGTLALGICFPSSQNKTRPLEWEDRIIPAPLHSSGGHGG